MADGKIFHSRQEFEARNGAPKDWRRIVAEENFSGETVNPFDKPPENTSLDDFAATHQEDFDPVAKLRAEKLQKQREEKFRMAQRAVPLTPQFESWTDEAYEFGLKGSNYFRSMRYAKDINQGLKALENLPKGVTIFGSRFPEEGSHDYEQARQLAALLAANGHPVITGGGPGIMEAANRGAYESGGVSVGLKIHLPNLNEIPNNYTTHEVTFQYFFARKTMLVNAAKVFVFFPGGFGTLDELTEVLVLLQEQKMISTPIFLIGSQWWAALDRFFQQNLMEPGFLNQGDLDIYKITDDINDVVAATNQLPSYDVPADDQFFGPS